MPSAVIRSFDYDDGRRELHIRFQSGKSYVYQDVPRETFNAMKRSFSKSEFFNEHIRDRLRFARDTATKE